MSLVRGRLRGAVGAVGVTGGLGNSSTHRFTVTRDSCATAATMPLAPGTWNVGICVHNN